MKILFKNLKRISWNQHFSLLNAKVIFYITGETNASSFNSKILASTLRLGRSFSRIWFESPPFVCTRFWTIMCIKGSVSIGERSSRARRSQRPVIIFSRIRLDSRAAKVRVLSLSYKKKMNEIIFLYKILGC